MNEIRHKRIESLVFRELNKIFSSIARNNYPGKLISVSEVRITPDLSIAKVYLSIYPSQAAEDIIKDIQYNKSQIRYEFGNRVRHQLRKIPELRFFIDPTMDKIEKISKLLNDQKDNNQNK